MKLVHTGTLAFLRPRDTQPYWPDALSVSFSAADHDLVEVFGKARPFAAKSSLL
jgi:hypothetical protein